MVRRDSGTVASITSDHFSSSASGAGFSRSRAAERHCFETGACGDRYQLKPAPYGCGTQWRRYAVEAANKRPVRLSLFPLRFLLFDARHPKHRNPKLFGPETDFSKPDTHPGTALPPSHWIEWIE